MATITGSLSFSERTLMNRIGRASIYVFFPLLNNVVLAVSAFIFNFGDFTAHRFVCYATVSAALAGTFIALKGFRVHELSAGSVLCAMIAHCLTIIVVFAGIYRGYG
jgi:hypothetical protein